MKKTFFMLAILLGNYGYSQNDVSNKNELTMKLNAGVITEKLAESKAFYVDNLGFNVTFENDFYVLLETPEGVPAISFLQPNHPSQQPLFQPAFPGQGMYLTIEVEDVDELYRKVKEKGVAIKIDIRDEPWGDRHFAVQDPNGIGIDLVKFTSPD